MEMYRDVTPVFVSRLRSARTETEIANALPPSWNIWGICELGIIEVASLLSRVVIREIMQYAGNVLRGK